MIDELEQLAVGYAQFDGEREIDQAPGATREMSRLRRFALKLAIISALGFVICATSSTLFL